jgi:hypothetical protein
LEKLQAAAYAAVAVAVADGGHVGMKKGLSGTPAGDGHGESDQSGAVIGAQNLAAGFGCDDEKRYGNHIKIGRFPDFALDPHAAFKFGDAVAVANHHPVPVLCGRRIRADGLGGLALLHDLASAES